MKKLIFATVALVATLSMVSCQKAAQTASIVGSWETTKTELSATDKDGKTVTLEEVIFQSLKKTLGAVPVEGISDDESLRKMAAETVKESQTTEFVKMTFEADGTVKNSVKGEDGNYGKEDVGTYKLNGNNLTFTVTADGKNVNVNATVLSLTATELKLQMDAQNALTSGGEDMAKLYKEVLGDFNLIMVETYKRL